MIDMTKKPENVHSRSISPENLSGEKGKGAMIPPEEGSQGRQARELGLGWKTNPFVVIKPGEVMTFGEIEGSGVITHIWMTPAGGGRESWRNLIFRIYWEGEKTPSVEAPVADFFCCGWQEVPLARQRSDRFLFGSPRNRPRARMKAGKNVLRGNGRVEKRVGVYAA